MDNLLEVKNLRVSYHTYAGEVQSVRGVDFTLNKGETLAIVGESGCGKTVTSKSVMGLIKKPGEIKKDSQIMFCGEDVVKMTDNQLRKLRGADISMIFQDSMTALNPTMKIGRQIAENLIVHKGLSHAEAHDEVIKMLKLVDVPNPEKRMRQYPFEFSGGMRQRAMIAMALACIPKILIADEPTTALDVTIQAQIMDLIKDLQGKFGTAVILITHDLGVVADVADKVHVMYGGKIVEKGNLDDIFYNAKHPYTWALLQSVPRLDVKNKANLYSIKGTPPDLLKPPAGCPFASRCSFCMQICKDQMPEISTVSDTQQVSCWLQHSLAPKINLQEAFRGEV